MKIKGIAAALLTVALVSACGSLPATDAPSSPGSTKAASVSMTKAQEQAVAKAQSYIDLSGFSAKGLAKQLAFEGFSAADVAFAVKHVDVDWNAEAQQAAENYLAVTSFSKASLTKQLLFDGFTKAQAAQAVQSTGL